MPPVGRIQQFRPAFRAQGEVGRQNRLPRSLRFTGANFKYEFFRGRLDRPARLFRDADTPPETGKGGAEGCVHRIARRILAGDLQVHTIGAIPYAPTDSLFGGETMQCGPQAHPLNHALEEKNAVTPHTHGGNDTPPDMDHKH